MRIATMILSLILMLVLGAQSCAVSLGEAALVTKAAKQGGHTPRCYYALIYGSEPR
jgi:hypothetical protein